MVVVVGAGAFVIDAPCSVVSLAAYVLSRYASLGVSEDISLCNPIKIGEAGIVGGS